MDLVKGVARRLVGLPPTFFSEMSAFAVEHKAVNLGQGFPDFDGPESVLEAACRGIRDGVNQYSASVGAAALRQAVAEHAARFHGMEVDPTTMVTITCGATEAIFDAIVGLVNPGDEVVLFEPFFDSYTASTIIAGGVPRYVLLRPPDESHSEWWFSEDELRAAFGDRTALVIVNTPHNPTGKVFSARELELIAELCQKHDVVAISDEVYEHLVFEPARHARIAMLPGMRERTITVSSVGKSFSLTGWRVGWIIAVPELRYAVQHSHQFVTFSAPSPLQLAAATALRLPDAYFQEFTEQYRRRRDSLSAGLSAVGLPPFVGEGSYFLMVDITNTNFDDDLAFARYLTTELGVTPLPTSQFYSPASAGRAKYVRFAYCKRDAVIAEAIGRLASHGASLDRRER